MTTPTDPLRLTRSFPLPPPAGGRGQGEGGRRARSADAHLTLPPPRIKSVGRRLTRAGPLPLPPTRGEGFI
jgi:hypothetical protein